MKEILTIEKIKFELIKSCVNYDTRSFIPFLLSENVFTGMPNKIRFYSFYKKMVNSTEQNSKGKLIFKIKTILRKKNEWRYYLEFYDEFYRNPKLTFEITESEKIFFLNTMPF